MWGLLVCLVAGIGCAQMAEEAAVAPAGVPLNAALKSTVAIDPAVIENIEANRTADYLVYFDQRPDLSAAAGMDWTSRGRFVVARLQETARQSQAAAIAQLDARGAMYRAFFVDNVIAVRQSDMATLNALSSLPGIRAIQDPPKVGLIEPVAKEPADAIGTRAAEANISHVGAPDVWAEGIDGSGIVVANIDTGVRGSHSVLQSHYRGNQPGWVHGHDYNWWDPYDATTAPMDGNGHGTHTMGTIVGSDGTAPAWASAANTTGMAPGARWMACRGCNTSSCGSVELLECAEWVIAPWNLAGTAPNPDLRPHVVNNSWGDCGRAYNNWYQGAVDTWHAAGIYPVFSNGNNSNCGYAAPPGCNTVGNPARYGNVTGVGSTGQANGTYASHSNWGPTDHPDTINPRDYPTVKPQVMAPGVSIRSSVNTGDTTFASWSGTSMSAPHVVGLVALAWQAAPCLIGQYADTETLMETSATPIPDASGCAGEGDGGYPSMKTGWGEINASAFVQAAMAWCGPSGTLRGTVRESPGGLPVAGATVRAGTRSTLTTADGTYVLSHVGVGTYEVTATHTWFEDASVPNVTIVEDGEVVVDLAMTPQPFVPVTGVVRDGSGHGWPLYARITIQPPNQGTPLTVFSDPFTGAWSGRTMAGVAMTYTVTPQSIQRSGARGSGLAGSSRCSRIRFTTTGSVRKARTTRGRWDEQRGHCRASMSRTLRNSWAQPR